MTSNTYQEVLRDATSLPLVDRQRLIAELELLDSHELQKTHSIMEFEGLGADIWKGTDAQKYVHAERASWDR